MTAEPMPLPDGPWPAGAARLHPSPSSLREQSDDDRWPTTGTTLLIAATPEGELYAMPLSTADPRLFSGACPMPAFGPGAARTYGAGELTEAGRDALGTDVAFVTARPFRLVWGRPGHTPASHVPAWLVLHADGTATVVDILRTDALTGGADLVPMAETAQLCKNMGWRYELIVGTDPSVDRRTLIETVLAAPDDMVSGELWGAAFQDRGLPALVDAIVTPGDLLTVRPYLLACWAAADAARASTADRPVLFGRP